MYREYFSSYRLPDLNCIFIQSCIHLNNCSLSFTSWTISPGLVPSPYHRVGCSLRWTHHLRLSLLRSLQMISTVQSHLEFSCSHSRPVAVGSNYQRWRLSGYREREGLVRCARRQTGVPHKTNTSSAQPVSYECSAPTR